ncbi:DNA (cytosine-5)-methyltransferase [Plasmodium sp. gorilla clade G3]|nr:DNA (cytosine-5)-methyltransferase [Plasmodium sp. gorilla clade G3]
MHKIKVLELYCGIGGLHYSLLQAFINFVHINRLKGKHDILKVPVDVYKKNDMICNCENECHTYKDNIHNDMRNYKSIEIHKYHDCSLTCLNDLFCFISVDLNPIANQTYFHNFKDSTIFLTQTRDIHKFFKWKCDSMDKQCHVSTHNEDEKTHTKKKKKKKYNDDDDYEKNNIFNINKNYIIQTDINNIMPEFLNNHHFNILLISNPCQPYTRQNKKFKEINLDLLFCKRNVHKEDENNYICNDNNTFNSNHHGNENYHFNIDNLNIDELNNYLYNDKDERTKSFIHICTLLTKVDFKNLPEYIFIENVKNFELSSSFIYFIYSIKNNYSFQTYLLSPLQFGIPNERLRFYCICKKKNYDFKHANNLSEKNYMKDKHLNLYSNSLIPKNYLHKNNIHEQENNQSDNYNNISCENVIFYTPNLITYLDVNNNFNITNNVWNHINIYNNYLDNYQVQNQVLQKNASYCFDIININQKTSSCCNVANYYHHQKKGNVNNISRDEPTNHMKAKRNYAMCFTSNYGRYIKGSGSILYYDRKKDSNCDEQKTKKKKTNVSTKENNEYVHTSNYTCNPISHSDNDTYEKQEKKNCMKKYEQNVRYFTPTEISRLMGFKMKTNNKNVNQNEKRKNTYGNIFWNIDHINHTCAYFSNVHYCDVQNKNACLLTYQNITNANNHTYQNYHKNNCLCHEFVFPNFLTDRQKYKLIGNSVNVIVISYIFHVHNIFEHIHI